MWQNVRVTFSQEREKEGAAAKKEGLTDGVAKCAAGNALKGTKWQGHCGKLNFGAEYGQGNVTVSECSCKRIKSTMFSLLREQITSGPTQHLVESQLAVLGVIGHYVFVVFLIFECLATKNN